MVIGGKRLHLLYYLLIFVLCLLAVLGILVGTGYGHRLAELIGLEPLPCPLLGVTPTQVSKNNSWKQLQAGQQFCWSLIGNELDPSRLQEEFAAGVRLRTFTVSWRELIPAPGIIDTSYLASKQTELTQLYQAGFGVIFITGVHDPPDWIHAQYPDTYYVDQYGDQYSGDVDTGDLNLVFNTAMRNLAAGYLHDLFSYFGTNFVAVRLGGGRYGELTYPPAVYGQHSNCYWAFDRNAQAQLRVPGWKPGDPSPSDQAETFLTRYLNALVDFQSWQIETARKYYSGPLMILYPSWGMRPGDFGQAVSVNLNGTTPAEQNGEVQRGYDFSRQIQAITDPGVIITTTWLDADPTNDSGPDMRYWSPVKYLAYLIHLHTIPLASFGENTGEGSRTEMERSAAQMKRYGLIGMAWYNETELFSGKYASLNDFRQVISAYQGLLIFLPFLKSN